MLYVPCIVLVSRINLACVCVKLVFPKWHFYLFTLSIKFTSTNFMTMNFAPTTSSSAAVLRWSTSATGMQESLLTMRWILYSWPTCVLRKCQNKQNEGICSDIHTPACTTNCYSSHSLKHTQVYICTSQTM